MRSATVPASVSTSSATSAVCSRGTTSTCRGACGCRSRNASTVEVSCTTSAGIRPATIPQKTQSSCMRDMLSRKVADHAGKPRAPAPRATSVIAHAGVRLMPAPTVGWSADEALEQLYSAHWRRLVRLSVLLVHDQGAAEEIVQDSFVAVHDRWG